MTIIFVIKINFVWEFFFGGSGTHLIVFKETYCAGSQTQSSCMQNLFSNL